MSDWLELELAEELRPTAAPDELWGRIRSATVAGEFASSTRGVTGRSAGTARDLGPRSAHRREAPQASWVSWPIAAIVTLMIAAATLWLVAKGQEPALDLQQLAIQELRNPVPLEMRCSDPAQINAWVHRQAGVELAIPERTGVHLAGARVIQKGGARIAAVTYRVGDDTATLLVAPAAVSADFGHGHSQWQARSQIYALASSNPDRPEDACLLCHGTL